jgi:hypothetical protein
VVEIVVAVIGTILVWMPHITAEEPTPMWPTVLAMTGFWILAGILAALKRRR